MVAYMLSCTGKTFFNYILLQNLIVQNSTFITRAFYTMHFRPLSLSLSLSLNTRNWPSNVRHVTGHAVERDSIVTFYGCSEDLPGFRFSLNDPVSSSAMLNLTMGGIADSSCFVSMPSAWTIPLVFSFTIV